jgi:hypothetical protein
MFKLSNLNLKFSWDYPNVFSLIYYRYLIEKWYSFVLILKHIYIYTGRNRIIIFIIFLLPRKKLIHFLEHVFQWEYISFDTCVNIDIFYIFKLVSAHIQLCLLQQGI